jgi:hypothetical protein
MDGSIMPSIISTKTSGGGGIAVTGDTSGIMQLASANGTTAVTIDASQNVGIGTSTINAQLQFSNSVGSAGIANKIRLYDGSGTAVFGFGISNGQLNYNCGDGAHVFSTGGGTPAERMRIDSSGNVLVGTTTNNGPGKIALDFDSNANFGLSLRSTNGVSNNGVYARFYNLSNAQAGQIVQTASTTVSYTTSSDYRLKEDVTPMTGALEKIALLKPVTYKWKVDGSDGQGFIAHELQAVIPDCVVGEKDAVDAEGNPDYQGIDTSFLVATLTAAIQEQQAIITELKARIEVLETK